MEGMEGEQAREPGRLRIQLSSHAEGVFQPLSGVSSITRWHVKEDIIIVGGAVVPPKCDLEDTEME